MRVLRLGSDAVCHSLVGAVDVFDVLDLYVPFLAAVGGFRPVQRLTAWGVSDEIRFEWNEVPFASSRTSVPSDLASWTGLTAARQATEAASNQLLWPRFLEAVRAFLDAHEDWVLVVEADCGQHPVEAVELTSAEVIERLEIQRLAPRSAFAMRARLRRTRELPA